MISFRLTFYLAFWAVTIFFYFWFFRSSNISLITFVLLFVYFFFSHLLFIFLLIMLLFLFYLSLYLIFSVYNFWYSFFVPFIIFAYSLIILSFSCVNTYLRHVISSYFWLLGFLYLHHLITWIVKFKTGTFFSSAGKVNRFHLLSNIE